MDMNMIEREKEGESEGDKKAKKNQSNAKHMTFLKTKPVYLFIPLFYFGVAFLSYSGFSFSLSLILLRCASIKKFKVLENWPKYDAHLICI